MEEQRAKSRTIATFSEVSDAYKKLAAEGIKRVEVICPGFSADCLETLEEIAVENHDIFTRAGGEALFYIPALNSRDDHIAMMAGLITGQ